MQTGSQSAGPKIDQNWRLKAANGLTWRLAIPEDMASIFLLWQEMDRKLGKQDKPDLFDMPVMLTLVAEDEAGTIRGAIYGEAVVDFTGIGTDRAVMEAVPDLFPTLRDYLGERTIRVVRVAVPRLLRRGMARALPGLVEITQRLAVFVYTIRL